MAQPPLTIILQAASALAGNTTTAKHKTQADFAGALRAHLRDFHLKLGTASPLTAAPTDESSTSQHDVENYIDHLRDENVESVTAEMALWAVTRVHAVEAQEQDPGESRPPMILILFSRNWFLTLISQLVPSSARGISLRCGCYSPSC